MGALLKARASREVRLGEFLSPPEQAHGDKETGEKRTPEPGTVWYWAEFRHRDRMRHGGDNGYGKDANRKIGGPRYLLASLCAGPGSLHRAVRAPI